MLLLDKRFASHAALTDSMTALIENGRWAEFATHAHRMLSSSDFPEVLLVWSDVISLLNPDGGVNAFGPPEEAGQWRSHAIALVDAAADRILKAHRGAAAEVVRVTTPEVQDQLVSLLAGYVRNVFSYAGGRERLMACARVHHACLANLFTTRQRRLIASPAGLITVIAARGDWEMANRCLQRLGTASPDALKLMLLVWLQVAAAQQFEPGPLAVDRGGKTAIVDADPDADEPKIRHASLFAQALQLVRRQDRDGLATMLSRLEALPRTEYRDIVWHAAGTVAARLGQLRSCAG